MQLQAASHAVKSVLRPEPLHHAQVRMHAAMHRATAELVTAVHALRCTDTVPGFTLHGVDGRKLSAFELLAQGPLVLLFRPGLWCANSHPALQKIRAVLPDIEGHGAQLVVVSPASCAAGCSTHQPHQPSLPVFCDPDSRVADAFGLRFRLPEYLVDIYNSIFRNASEAMGTDPHWTLPVAANFVMAADGEIVCADTHPDAALHSFDKVMRVLKNLKTPPHRPTTNVRWPSPRECKFTSAASAAT